MAGYRPLDSSDQHGSSPTVAPRARTKSENRISRVHWHAPATMISSFLLGLFFAIGHDRFYYHYDRRPVESSFQQTVIVTVGTAFAFMVKMFLAISTATAFSQQIWLSLRCRGESIHDIDNLFNILGNVLHFGKVTLWVRHWILALIALATWCIPLAAIFTPGTIHVQPDLSYQNNTLLKPVQPQQFWYGTQNYAATQFDNTLGWNVNNISYGTVINNGPSGSLYSVALGSVSRRSVLAIPPPSQNSSYELSFFGPSLSCNSLSTEEYSTFNTSLTKAYSTFSLPGMRTILGIGESERGYLVLKYNAWVGTNLTDELSSPGYNQSFMPGEGPSSLGYNLSHPYWNNETLMLSPTDGNFIYFYFSSISQQDDSSVLVACHLRNATYNVGFSFENSQQSINVQSVTRKEAVPYSPTLEIENPNYGNIVYNSVLYAFTNIVLTAAMKDNSIDAHASNVMYYGGSVSASALRDFIEAEPSNKLTADAVIDTLQETFQNITLSTMSSPSLRLPDSQAKAIETNIWHNVNVYIYKPTDLYVAYGCALLASCLCVLWGLYVSLHRNRVSYSLGFSTFLRTTRRSEINGIVDEDARRGNDPVPKAMKGVKLRYIGGERRSGGEGFALVHHGEEMRMLSPRRHSNG
ncbi:MAG: hypothetical protein FRX48_01793 [Lasallia pustulata]|uniref:Uncharacterized protein n=1 Tax=Lasallia pustulata TaxID=136370 RepID=A0A5M8Q133_9LECA|nr:MAG: hypothetical protein FRX48_01793 [Lasallia pustulata]